MSVTRWVSHECHTVRIMWHSPHATPSIRTSQILIKHLKTSLSETFCIRSTCECHMNVTVWVSHECHMVRLMWHSPDTTPSNTTSHNLIKHLKTSLCEKLALHHQVSVTVSSPCDTHVTLPWWYHRILTKWPRVGVMWVSHGELTVTLLWAHSDLTVISPCWRGIL